MNRRPRTGFTLVELLVVTSICSIIAFGVASSFLSGLRLWDRARRLDAARASALLALEVMARELRQSVDLPSLRFSGASQEVSFPAALGDGLVNVVYRYDASTKRVQRRQVSLKEMLEERLEPAYQDRALCSSVDGFLIEFGVFDKDAPDKGYEWKNDWDGEDGIPSAVRLTITLKREVLMKTVWLPIA